MWLMKVRPFLAAKSAVKRTISRSKADIEGGSAIYSYSAGGSFNWSFSRATCTAAGC